MNIVRNTKTIAELYNGLKDHSVEINHDYQRSPKLWPLNARSYFIDTILNGYPFPKIVLWQKVDLQTRKTKAEIIDGQQRLMAIKDFIENKLTLSKVSKKFHQKKYEDLNDCEKEQLLSYEVSLDNIVVGTKEEVLQIFKRINSYNLALTKIQQRYATYQGEFKWFINDLTNYISPFLQMHSVLSDRAISRMEDDDLIAECCLQYLDGISARSQKKLDDLYKKYDESFPDKDKIGDVIRCSFDFLKNNFNEVFVLVNIKQYNFYSLLGALIYNKFGFRKDPLPDISKPQRAFCKNVDLAKNSLIELFSAVEHKDEYLSYSKRFKEMIDASSSSTHTLKNRLIRFKNILLILQSDD